MEGLGFPATSTPTLCCSHSGNNFCWWLDDVMADFCNQTWALKKQQILFRVIIHSKDMAVGYFLAGAGQNWVSLKIDNQLINHMQYVHITYKEPALQTDGSSQLTNINSAHPPVIKHRNGNSIIDDG